jgi:phospholipid-translocating ATPase
MSQFVIHRGMIISIIQVIFSTMFYFLALPIFPGMLQIGYSTYYTMAPVFALCLDYDLPESTVYTYPQLYETLREGRVMSIKVFLTWVLTSVYQAGAIMLVAVYVFEDKLLTNMVAITFTALIFSELLNVASEVHQWHRLMVASQIVTVLVYLYSLVILRGSFDINFIASLDFLWKVAVITAVSWVPVHFWKIMRRCIRPPQHRKLLTDTDEGQGYMGDALL